MAADTINYEDKVSIVSDVTIPDKNKVTASDLNEIKDVVNEHASELDTHKTEIDKIETIPIGAIMSYGGNVAPENWLLCNGQAVSRSTYSRLFALIGTIYGAGNGSTTFNVPNIVDRYEVGAGGSRTIGAKGGTTSYDFSHTHTLNTALAANDGPGDGAAYTAGSYRWANNREVVNRRTITKTIEPPYIAVTKIIKAK